MPQATISARVDSNDKTAFDSFCNDVGISSSTAINMFIKAVLREHRIPFSINNDPFYSESNMAFLREGVQALNSGKGTFHELIEEDD